MGIFDLSVKAERSTMLLKNTRQSHLYKRSFDLQNDIAKERSTFGEQNTPSRFIRVMVSCIVDEEL